MATQKKPNKFVKVTPSTPTKDGREYFYRSKPKQCPKK
jgi:hypothetical protein